MFKIISKNKISNFKYVSGSISFILKDFLGELGLAKAGIRILDEKWDPDQQTGVIRINHKYVNELKAALTLVKEINHTEAIISSQKVSGMLNKAMV